MQFFKLLMYRVNEINGILGYYAWPVRFMEPTIYIPWMLRFQNLEEKHALRVQLENMVEELWAQFQQALKNYQETTEERKKAFEELKAKDEKSANEIEMQMRKLQRISVSITQME